MKPKSSHWADQTAARLIAQLGDRDEYVVASGITPSGSVHIGNFREVITVDLVARALKDIGKKVRFIYSWDDFDTFRKVPINLPEQDMLKTHLRQPINRVPDPFGKEESYARSNEVAFEKELVQVGIHPEFIYQSKQYSNGVYAEQVRYCLENTEELRTILNRHRTTPLADEWLPTAIYCEKCDRDEMEYERYDGEWNYAYKCKLCDHEAVAKINETKNIKLNWRTDWPMRWNYEKVDFEPGGKDHSSEGGSYDTGKQIVKKLWQRPAPIYLQYDFVSIKGLGGKMSSSKGVLITLSQAFEVYTPQMIRWIFAMQRSNHDFSISFDEDVIKSFDEYDRAEKMALGPKPEKAQKWELNRRVYELAAIGDLPEKAPYRAPYRVLCNRLQICDGDIQRTMDKYYSVETKDQVDRAAFEERAKLAWSWIEKHAPEEFCYRINTAQKQMDISDLDKLALGKLRQMLEGVDLEAIESKELNQKIYDDVIHGAEVEAKEFFPVVYQKLINRDRGPRLPSFLKEIGKSRLLELI